MRSTRAVGALRRLQERSGNAHYAMVRSNEGLFFLALRANAADGTAATRLSEGLELDAFVQFVDAFGPQKPRRATKSDLAFELQLKKKTP
jgi:hypothetical protein